MHVEFAAPETDTACTSDLVPRVTLVGVPQDVDPAESLDIEVTGDEYFGQVELEGVEGLDPSGETDYEPSAGWATAPGQFVILTWGSSTCIPVIEDVAATGPAEVTVTYQTPPDNQACTMDMVPRGGGHRGERPRGRQRCHRHPHQGRVPRPQGSDPRLERLLIDDVPVQLALSGGSR